MATFESSIISQSEIVLEKVTCDFCRSSEAEPFMPSLRLVRCRNCDLVYVSERLLFDKLREIYSKEYFTSAKSSELGYENYECDRNQIRKTFEKRLHQIEKLSGNRKGKCLDVGCAMGFFLEVAKERRWQASGIDISEYCVHYGRQRGLNLNVCTLAEFQADPGSFDLVTMWDYIEHSPSPISDFQKAHALLKPDGLSL